MSDCTHDCSSCGESCAERQGARPAEGSGPYGLGSPSVRAVGAAD